MKVKELYLNGFRTLVMDAPLGTTHTLVDVNGGARYVFMRKKKMIDAFCFDRSLPDALLVARYASKHVNITDCGSLPVAHEGILGQLFNAQRRGNFVDYEYNGIFYPTAKGLLKDLISEDKFTNPYVLLINE